jgi:hypothetical protein
VSGRWSFPASGRSFAVGTLGSVLTGAGIGAAAGGLIGALAGMGVPDEDAKHFERGFQDGGVLVTVEAGGDAARARQALILGDADLGPAHATMRTSGAAASHEADRLELGEEAGESWRGNERRYREDAEYAGPERRLATR